MKPFLIVNVVEGALGVIHERSNHEEALDCAVDMAAEQCDTDRQLIRKELSEDNDYQGNGFRVYLTQTEDYKAETCRYCSGNCPNEPDDSPNLCDGFAGDVDGLYP